MRKRTGLVCKPWYSNETALATAMGQEGTAARAVWQKILYAMAWGSTDYIWYTLRATGWNSEAGEDSYGLVTPDYKPRATFAAFSALAAVVQGARFDVRLVENDGRYIYRLHSPNGHGLTLTGWDEALAGKADVLRVGTDASSAQIVDLMGNVVSVPVRDGFVNWSITHNPSALLLGNATYAEMR